MEVYFLSGRWTLNYDYRRQSPQAAGVVVEPIRLLVVPKLKELFHAKLVGLQHLELVDLGLQLVR